MTKIIPSILVKTEQEFLDQIRAIATTVESIQLDIADGVFVPNTTWADPLVVQKELQIPCELHLMVADPLRELVRWTDVPQVKKILVHYESVQNFTDIVSALKKYGCEIWIVLNPTTEPHVLAPFSENIDGIMLMGVIPGKQGQTFIPETLNRIRACKSLYPNLPVQIDGGVNEDTLHGLIAAGADIVSPGSAIFGNGRAPTENVQRLKNMIQQLS